MKIKAFLIASFFPHLTSSQLRQRLSNSSATLEKSTPPSLQTRLELIQRVLTNPNSTLTCWGDDYTGSRDDFINGIYTPVLSASLEKLKSPDTIPLSQALSTNAIANSKKEGNSAQYTGPLPPLPTLLYPNCIRTYQLGNTLGTINIRCIIVLVAHSLFVSSGYYFNDIACANESGLHFVAANRKFSIQFPLDLEVPPEYRTAFLDALPSIIAHPRPASDLEKVRVEIKQKCNCLQFCWENSAAPWYRAIPVIQTILRKAFDAYLSHIDASKGMVLNNSTDLCSKCINGVLPLSSGKKQVLPLLSDVTVQYRCGDNVGFGRTRYGLLPFNAISSRIPQNTTSIYVLADAPGRNPKRYIIRPPHPYPYTNPTLSIYSNRCGPILEALYKHLVTKFPFALIVVKRGGDIFLDMIRMGKAKVRCILIRIFILRSHALTVKLV